MDVYYSLENGIVKSETRANWDIAFTSSKMSASILSNGGSGVELYSYPNGDTNAWATVDTAAYPNGVQCKIVNPPGKKALSIAMLRVIRIMVGACII